MKLEDIVHQEDAMAKKFCDGFFLQVKQFFAIEMNFVDTAFVFSKNIIN